jgi:hypothetical protein
LADHALPNSDIDAALDADTESLSEKQVWALGTA